ncbi:MAG: hypothetical protein AB1405_15110 [Bdellovibrionota bacterium]
MISRKSLLFLGSVVLLSFIGCNEHTEGSGVDVLLTHHFEEIEEGIIPTVYIEEMPRVFETDEDFTITLSAAYVVITGMEIHSCEEHAGFFPKLLKLFSPVGVAHAHGESSATQIGTPFVENILRPDLVPALYGRFSPPPGSYCELHVEFGPADADAENLPGDVDMVGKTLYVAGQFLAPGDTEGVDEVAFQVASAAEDHAMISFSHGASLSKGVRHFPVEAGEPSELVLGFLYDTWLDGLDFETVTDEAARAAVIFPNVVDSLHRMAH